MILNLLVEVPLVPPDKVKLLTQFRILHPNPQSLKLVASKITGVTSNNEAFGTQPLLASVVNGIQIPLRCL